MTEKRFEWDNVNIAIYDNENRKKYYTDITCIDELVDLLNELHEENQQLKNKLSKIEKKIKVLQSL